jgi:S-adenosylmethionine:tRNA ribosyltransferase-isomerase
MLTAELEYDLPRGLVAQTPAEPRDAARRLVWDRARGVLSDRVFRDLPGLLRAGDVLVRNDTRVFPARAWFRRPSGGRLEVLFLHPAETRHAAATDSPVEAGHERWEALIRGRSRVGETLTCSRAGGDEWRVRCETALGDGRWELANLSVRDVQDELAQHGETPLPPYIHQALDDGERYQTTYGRRVGSAAAPTAGLHFTPALDRRLRDAGVAIEEITLHVGLATFRPINSEIAEDHVMHGERYFLEGSTWERILSARAQDRRVIAVGTTSVRVLEHVARTAASDLSAAVLSGETSLFIMPGFEFRVVDGLLTNFHLPRTSLLALVMAFCGVGETRSLYKHAIAHRYRFYSFGDAMLVT